jgi:hypothetical protein
MAGGIKKNWRAIVLVGIKFFLRPMAEGDPALLSCLHPSGPGLEIGTGFFIFKLFSFFT